VFAVFSVSTYSLTARREPIPAPSTTAHHALTRPTYAQIAASFDLWQEYADSAGTTSRDEFDAMTTADRVDLLLSTFGPEPEQAPTVDDVLASTAIGNGFHDWAVQGGTIRLTEAELRPALEAAYDSTMPDWIVMVDIDG